MQMQRSHPLVRKIGINGPFREKTPFQSFTAFQMVDLKAIYSQYKHLYSYIDVIDVKRKVIEPFLIIVIC
jgi:hypothetical protein